MCLPCGPRRSSFSEGRKPFATLNDCICDISLETAQEKYPDNDKALEEIKKFIHDHIDHTEKWIINELYINHHLLARIYAIEDNSVILSAFYKKEKKQSTKGKK